MIGIDFEEYDVDEVIHPEVKSFKLLIEIKDRDELYAFTKAVGTMCNGHGLSLYPFLKDKCAKYNVDIG